MTHGHGDHVGEAIDLGKRTGAKLVSSVDLGRVLVAAGYPKDQAGVEMQGNVGGTIDAGDAKITLVPAVHPSDFQGASGPTVRQPRRLVIRVKGGPTLYHTGDTDVTLAAASRAPRHARSVVSDAPESRRRSVPRRRDGVIHCS